MRFPAKGSSIYGETKDWTVECGYVEPKNGNKGEKGRHARW